ncbi:uncharacterized protein LOC109708656 isoform X2 [Ananas comosus]|uniref:Uncharacterized protein LOC109708656 isoform X2 n=1 Tax=Ananas comosus TaxID=4615 RepID=A0A6P5EY33_ANACO|nr:uncharacterized protein LOC109708656 isoform X2 [Ananas comosus]
MGNSASSSQLPAGADGRRGVARSSKSEEENDAASSSVAVRAAVKVGTAVARAVLMVCGACSSANSLRSEHPIEDDRHRRDMLGTAGTIGVEEIFGGGRKDIAALTVAEDRFYQLGGEGRGIGGGYSRGSGGDDIGDTTEEDGIGGGVGGSSRDSGMTEWDGIEKEGGGIEKEGDGIENRGFFFSVKNYQKSAPRIITFMTYNVWKQEGKNLQERIKKIGSLVEKHSPDVIFFQLSKFPIKAKRCVSSIARKLPGCELNVGIGRRLYVANGHLKRPNRPGMHCEIRKTQAKEAVKLLNCSRNAVFGGDMNWDEHRDGQFPLPKRWVDAWTRLKPNNNGWTYDTKSNKSLKGRKLLQKRLDRFVCKLRDFTLKDIKIIGNDAEPPSDHYGLLLTICYK